MFGGIEEGNIRRIDEGGRIKKIRIEKDKIDIVFINKEGKEEIKKRRKKERKMKKRFKVRSDGEVEFKEVIIGMLEEMKDLRRKKKRIGRNKEKVEEDEEKMLELEDRGIEKEMRWEDRSKIEEGER